MSTVLKSSRPVRTAQNPISGPKIHPPHYPYNLDIILAFLLSRESQDISKADDPVVRLIFWIPLVPPSWSHQLVLGESCFQASLSEIRTSKGLLKEKAAFRREKKPKTWSAFSS